MVIPPLTDNMYNNIHNTHNTRIWNLVGKKKKEVMKRKTENLLSWGPQRNGLLSSEVSYAFWWATWEGKLKFSWVISILLWHRTGSSYWFSRGKTFNEVTASLESETFSSYQHRDVHDFGRSHPENRERHSVPSFKIPWPQTWVGG